jgi:deazaflavin-dependent oxidoreductase (nitroreductase family)
MANFNSEIIDEFRSHDGRVGGPFADMPLLLLHHKGARTGTERVNPLAYLRLDGGWAIFASKAGADTNPDWLHNLMANPETRIEVGNETVDVRARLAEGEEYADVWERHTAAQPTFAEYAKKTRRDHIPAVILEPA